MRCTPVFFYLDGSERDEPDQEETGGTVGGDSIFGKLALMRTKLGLTENELLNSSWIYLNMQMMDFPYYDPKKKNVIKGSKAISILDKYIKK